MTYPEASQYLESFINYEIISTWPYKESLKLERIKAFLSIINNPEGSLKCIHIAGTKGKGSTCAFISYILSRAGYRVGLYTSPHLSDFRERIRILSVQRSTFNVQQDYEGMISKNDLVSLVTKLKPAIDKYNRNPPYGPLSFFEVYTALAFEYFKEKKADFAVLETGLGGRLDATNVVEPLVCAITPISYEHTQKLGNSLRQIAQEKAGIVKIQNPKSNGSTTPVRLTSFAQGCPELHRRTEQSRSAKIQKLFVISAPQKKEAIEVIRARCKKVGAKLYEIGRDIVYQKTKDGFRVKGIFNEYKDLKIKLLGEHQLVNATVAVGVIEALRNFGMIIGINAIRKGIYNTRWPGRCEVISKEPWVVLDGAQNTTSAICLKETIKENFQYKRLILVLGISRDKDIKGICRKLLPIAQEVILTQADNPRASEVDLLEEIIKKHIQHNSFFITKTKDVGEAIELATKKANSQDLVLVTGSLFMIGEAREILYARNVLDKKDF